MPHYSESQSRDQFICQRFSALRNKKLYTGRRLGVTGSMMTKNPAFSDDLPFQPRILAIQSAVLVGAVGNDAAILFIPISARKRQGWTPFDWPPIRVFRRALAILHLPPALLPC